MVAAIKRPGWIRGALGALARRRLRLRPRRRPARDLRPAALPDRTDRLPAGRRAADHRRRSASSPASAASTTGCAGRPALPTIPDDHSQHGAKSWKDYFRFNTDHKVIGIQYICTTFFFFFVGGLMAMLIRAELAQPGHPDRRRRRPTTASSPPTRC